MATNEPNVNPDPEPTGGYGGGTGTGNPEVGNADDRTVSDGEAQETAREADPDDLGSTANDSSLMAGGDAVDLGTGDDSGGGSPLTAGYVSGGTHRSTLEEARREER